MIVGLVLFVEVRLSACALTMLPWSRAESLGARTVMTTTCSFAVHAPMGAQPSAH